MNRDSEVLFAAGGQKEDSLIITVVSLDIQQQLNKIFIGHMLEKQPDLFPMHNIGIAVRKQKLIFNLVVL